MNCISDEIIQKYIDGEIKHGEIVLVEQHLMECTPCYEKVDLHRSLSIKLKTVINSIVDDNIEIPIFETDKGIPEQTFIKRNRYAISISALISAASLILFFAVFKNEKGINQNDHFLFIGNFDCEVDANQPATQQPLLIHITKPDGKQIDYIMN